MSGGSGLFKKAQSRWAKELLSKRLGLNTNDFTTSKRFANLRENPKKAEILAKYVSCVKQCRKDLKKGHFSIV